MQNHRTPSEIKTALDAIAAELAVLDVATVADDELVPLARTVQAVAGFAAVIGRRITARAIDDGVLVPGAARKPGITHRRWHDPVIAAELAFKSFGLDAFGLESPAALEKLGDEGKALVAVASYKPEAPDRVVY
jgi:hypothetical protein